MSLRISTAVAALGCALATTASFHSPDAARADSPTVSAPPPARPAAYGVNIAANTDWSVDQAWVDVRNLFRRWGRLGKPWEENPSLPLSDDGYPLDDASSLTYLKGYPDGTYHLRFRGSATVTFSGMGRLAGPVVSANGVSTGDVIVDHRRGELLILNVRGVDVIDPIRDLRLIRPDLPPETTEVFSERFLHRLRPFSVVRFMDWTRTNNSQVRDWSGRVVPTSFLRTGPGGVAYEDVVALANALKKDVWINVPDEATGEFVVQLARLLRDTLDPDLAVYVEYSNEVWNSTFAQAKRLSASAMTNPHLTKPDAFGRAGELAAERLVSIATIFRSETCILKFVCFT